MKIHVHLLGLLLVIVGCNMLQPVKDLATHHVLDPLVPDRKLSLRVPAIAVNRPSLPEYLDQQQLVSRAGGDLVLSDHHLWAEPLDASMARVTASNLSRLTGSMNIQTVASFTTLDYTDLLEIHVARFEPDTANHMIFEGTWKLQSVNGRESHAHFFRFEFQFLVFPDPMTGRITAMNEALERLARQIGRNL